MDHTNTGSRVQPSISIASYSRLLLLVAGLGGLLYGIDVGIIAGALPYLDAQQLSFVVAAVLLGAVLSTLFAGALADRMGRKPLMILSGVLFVASIPTIALARGYEPLMLGRLLQGISAGFIGIVVPLYLAECLGADNRGTGTAMFQWVLTFGIVAAAAIGMYFSIRVGQVARLGDAAALFAFKERAWRSIFWVSLPPGILFVAGGFLVAESPRWLHRRGRAAEALAALLRSRSEAQATVELREMEEAALAERARDRGGAPRQREESLLHRKYVIPFLLACIIPLCNQTTGVNSIIGYNATILLQAGLTDVQAHWGYVLLTAVNFLSTIGGVLLVDRRGRKFLLSVGSAGIIVSLAATGALFHMTERMAVDRGPAVQRLVTGDQKLALTFDRETAARLLGADGGIGPAFAGRPVTLLVMYSCGDFRAASRVVRSDDPVSTPLEVSREGCVPSNRVLAFFSNPLGDLGRARGAPLVIEHAWLTPAPGTGSGWLTAVAIYGFMASFAIGPGICGWLALSELMPTRIRSKGMSIALLPNQVAQTAIAAVFLPMVGRYGYAAMFFFFAGCTVVYLVTAVFFLPETKGKTLEEIEAHFEGRRH